MSCIRVPIRAAKWKSRSNVSLLAVGRGCPIPKVELEGVVADTEHFTGTGISGVKGGTKLDQVAEDN